LLSDDGGSQWPVFRTAPGMAERSLEERLSALEAQLGNKPIDEHFREQAQLIERLFDAKLRPVRHDLNIIKHAAGVLLMRQN